MLIAAILVYALAMTIANLGVVHFGPERWLIVTNAVVLIGLDLALRDWLHVKLKPLQMLGLIVATGALTYLLNPAAGKVVVASAVAFTLAASADWGIFSVLRRFSWQTRSNASNVGGALVDSIVFPTLAWGSPLDVILMMFAAKVIGGAMWAVLIARYHKE